MSSWGFSWPSHLPANGAWAGVHPVLPSPFPAWSPKMHRTKGHYMCVSETWDSLSPSEMGNLLRRQENTGHPGWNSAGCHLQELTEKLELMYPRTMLRLVLSAAVCYSYRYARNKCVFYHFGYIKKKNKQVLSVPVYRSLCTRIMQSLWCDVKCYFIFLKQNSYM